MRPAALSLIVSWLLIAASAALYPGGTVFDAHEPGFSFWRNYWCDLLSFVALNGGDNRLGAWLARAGFAGYAVALWQFWPLAAGLTDDRVRPRLAVWLGRLGALALVGVSSLTAYESELGHAVLVLASAGASIAAALVLIPSLAPHVDALARWLGIGVTLSASVSLVQYLQWGLLRWYFADWLPGAQKVTTLLMLTWMARLLWQAGKDRLDEPQVAA